LEFTEKSTQLTDEVSQTPEPASQPEANNDEVPETPEPIPEPEPNPEPTAALDNVPEAAQPSNDQVEPGSETSSNTEQDISTEKTSEESSEDLKSNELGNENSIVHGPYDDELKTYFGAHLIAENTLIVAVANFAHKILVRNWRESLFRNTKNTNSFVVVCLDPQLYEYLQKHEIPSIPVPHLIFDEEFKNFYEDEGMTGEKRWEEKDYFRVTNAKIRVVYEIMARFSYSVIFSDVDLVWLHQPIVDFILHEKRAGPYDMMFTTEKYYDYSNICTGLYFAHNSTLALRFLRTVAFDDQIAADNDQFIAIRHFHNLSLKDRVRFGW
jgi:hypothetical protein